VSFTPTLLLSAGVSGAVAAVNGFVAWRLLQRRGVPDPARGALRAFAA